MKKYLAVYGKPRYLGILSAEAEIANGDKVIVESVRGEDIAICVGALNEEQEAAYRAMRNMIDRGDNVPKATEPAVTDMKYLRAIAGRDINEQGLFRIEERDILKKAKELVIPHQLDMKLIDVELLKGRQKLYVYFSADQRVDFRAYVRDLAREFRTRIELRQIGVRDESKIVGGLGLCGQPCCCSYWLHRFEPVGIKMVKDQNLALNPTKISGICGRLMCCMCYEHNVYQELWESMPPAGTKLKYGNLAVVVTGINIAKKALKCFIPDHGEKDIPISKFEEFKLALEGEKEWDALEEIIAPACANYPKFADDFSVFKNLAGHKKADEKRQQKQSDSGRNTEESKPARNKSKNDVQGKGHRAKPKQERKEQPPRHEQEKTDAQPTHRRRFSHKRNFAKHDRESEK